MSEGTKPSGDPLFPELTAAARKLLIDYADRVANYPRGLVSKEARKDVAGHVEDSLTPLSDPELRRIFEGSQPVKMVDIGSGGGFPAIPLTVSVAEIEVTCVESLAWKCEFLKGAAEGLGVAGRVRIHLGRAEEAALENNLMDAADIVTIRAVANINTALEYAAPFLKIGGHAVLWTTSKQVEGIASAELLQDELGIGDLHSVLAPSTIRQDGALLVGRKKKKCARGYPRRTGLAKKKPIGGEPTN